MAVLAERPDDAACEVAAEVVLGSPFVAADLRALAARCDVLTFDHEQVDLDLVAELAAQGAVVRPGADDARARRRQGPHADRARRRRRARSRLPRRRRGAGRARRASSRSPPPTAGPSMLKAARGGYDGKGVWPVADRTEAAAVLAAASRDRSWSRSCSRSRPSWPSWWPAVPRAPRRPGRRSRRPRSTASAGRCSCRDAWTPTCSTPASALGQKVAEIAGGVGVMAVELFWSGGRLLVNEVATRPHNSGHWTMEGAVTSQFENHVRAVLDLPLGSTAPQHPQVASVNVFGGADGDGSRRQLLARGLAVEGAHVHLYGKGARPGRKLGHVTVCGDEADDGARPGLVGRRRPRHARARRHRPAGRGRSGDGPGTPGRRRHGELVRPARDAGGGRRCSSASASPTRCASSRPTARRATCWPSGRRRPGAGSGCSSPARAAPPTCPACWPRSPRCPSSGSRWRSRQLDGLDSLLSIVQMPRGVPVATMAVNGARNAGLLAVRILAQADAGADRQDGGLPGGDRRRRPRPRMPSVSARRTRPDDG